MIKKYDSKAIEEKWRKKWSSEHTHDVGARDEQKEKQYILVELPYPSGNLHIGHWYAFAVPDIYVRYLRMQGKQVIYPMGFDAFGLPAENAAIKRNLDPRQWTEGNIEYMKNQLASMGNAFSWDKTTSTIDPAYYRWTQWMFTKFFEHDIAYRGKGTVNWCPGCNTVIANEQVLADGTCERSGDTIEKREMPQWMLKITNYADRLVDDLDVLDWPEHIKEAQRQWIGRSKGAKLTFTLNCSTSDVGQSQITVFTTRPDTLYGATYLVLAPEHPFVSEHCRGRTPTIKNYEEVIRYIELSAQKAEQDRLDATKEKTGVKLEGITATNPASEEEIPVYIADYVLGSYGTGAIMAVPAHDERDYAFAKKFDLPIKSVVAPSDTVFAGALIEIKNKPGVFLFQRRTKDAPTNPGALSIFGGGIEDGEDVITTAIREVAEELELTLDPAQVAGTYSYTWTQPEKSVCAVHFKNVDTSNYVLHEGEAAVELTLEEVLQEENVADTMKEFVRNLVHDRAYYSGPGVLLHSGEFSGMDSVEAKEAITTKVGGELTNTYRLRDWSIGRQRYWGVPIPIVYDPEGKAHKVPEEHLPWTLPADVDFRPTGEPPLAKSKELKERTEQLFGAGWTPEVETMDTFVDSSWYFLRYIDNQCDTAPASLETQKQWMPVDLYFGGAEHTTMHLLYSRFWQKALYDLGITAHQEPYKRRINRGLILGPDGNKMSKSKGNVIDPDEQVSWVGADAVKMYLAFMGPYEGSNYPWDTGGIAGLRRFLERVYGLPDHIQETEPTAVTQQLHKTIKKVGDDIIELKFNTAISTMMMFVNLAEKEGLTSDSYLLFVRTLAPFAPFLTEEIWSKLGEAGSVHQQSFPEPDTNLLTDSVVTIGVQINGKHRGEVTIAPDASKETALTAINEQAALTKYLTGTVTKVIYVPGRILNLIIAVDT